MHKNEFTFRNWKGMYASHALKFQVCLMNRSMSLVPYLWSCLSSRSSVLVRAYIPTLLFFCHFHAFLLVPQKEQPWRCLYLPLPLPLWKILSSLFIGRNAVTIPNRSNLNQTLFQTLPLFSSASPCLFPHQFQFQNWFFNAPSESIDWLANSYCLGHQVPSQKAKNDQRSKVRETAAC